MGVLRCHMPGCSNKGGTGFHKFPRDEETCLAWQRISKRRNLNTQKLPYSNYRLCKMHFKKDDYVKSCNSSGHLKKGVVPSILIPKQCLIYDEHNYVELPMEQVVNESQANLPLVNDTPDAIPQNHKKSDSINPLDDGVQPTELSNEQESSRKKNRKEVQNIRRKLRYSKARINFLQKKLKESTNVSKEKVVQYLASKFTKEQMAFFLMQIRNSGRKNHGQHYSNEEKSMLLALYRHGAKSYRFLSRLFLLPSKRTLNRHSALLQFETGINPKIFQFIKTKASQLNDLEKLCTISWDEMSLTSQLSFCETKDAMDGFADLGEIKIPEFATHALVFMIRGISLAYKQPVAYVFTANLNSDQLSELIKLVISEVLKTGMKIIGSVCDQTSTNAGAINKLAHPDLRRVVQDGQLLQYVVLGEKIIHCFDPPHILKVIRNNLQTKNLKHFISDVRDYKSKNKTQVKNVEMTATWDDVREFYTTNKTNASRLLRKITSEHIDPKKLKMKVYVAAQVFSNTLGNFMMYCSNCNQLPRDFSGTAHILIFVNDLFDSLNGTGKSSLNPLRSAIDMSNKAKHFEFWMYAISMLEKMSFVDKETGEVNNNSSVLKKTISTIKGYMELTNQCLSLGMKSVSLRRLNQDGLENFFGNIKAACYTTKQPMPFQFRSAFTNLIVTGLTAKHSMKSNCRDDESVALLQDTYDFYDMDIDEQQEQVDDGDDIIELDVDTENIDSNFLQTEALAFDSGNVCRQVLSRTNCESCRNTLAAYCPLDQHGIIKEFDKTSEPDNSFLTYPTVLFMKKFQMLTEKIEVLLPLICHENGLSGKLVSSVGSCSLQGLGCREHSVDISLQIKRATAKLSISTFKKQVNDVLVGKSLQPQNKHIIHEKAMKMVKKRKDVGKYGQVPMVPKVYSHNF